MADKSNAYVGKIKNSGAQVVQAPISGAGKKGTATVKKGDLRK